MRAVVVATRDLLPDDIQPDEAVMVAGHSNPLGFRFEKARVYGMNLIDSDPSKRQWFYEGFLLRMEPDSIVELRHLNP